MRYILILIIVASLFLFPFTSHAQFDYYSPYYGPYLGGRDYSFYYYTSPFGSRFFQQEPLHELWLQRFRQRQMYDNLYYLYLWSITGPMTDWER